jgi:RNA ligase (TIGR02306 family)
MRQLATIQRIAKLEPIPGADAIEKATVLGWEVVVEKGLYREGDLCCYCEIDSQMPEQPEFEFLRSRKFRIKTVRLRGQVSQGICFPVSILNGLGLTALGEGCDVSGDLGVKKYEPPEIDAKLAGQIKGSFPDFIPKTDETRIQSDPWLLDYCVGQNFRYFEKLDGTSFTAYFKNCGSGVCSRRLDLKEDDQNLYWKMAKKYNLEEKLRATGRDLALQGEAMGPGIKKNRLKLPEQQVYFFNVYDIAKQVYLDDAEVDACLQELNLLRVPCLGEMTIFQGCNVHVLVSLATGTSQLNPEVQREGIVFRPPQEQWISRFGRLSFKTINPEYLLKHSI